LKRGGDTLNIEKKAGDSVNPDLEESIRRKGYLLLRDWAYQCLARREYSQHELRQKLGRIDQFHQVEQLLRELIQLNAQSDLRFAEQLGRARVNAGKGPVLLEQELKQHRLDPLIIDAVMQIYHDEWAQRAEKARVKKFGSAPPVDYKEWSRQARFLQQRGFSVSEIPDYRE
jgi:regulatory protein